MERHLLVTVSEEIACLHGVRFVADFLENLETLRVTLLFVARTHTPDPWGGREYLLRGPHISNEVRWRGERALGEAKEMLIQRGMASDRIHTLLIPKTTHVAKEMAREAVRGNYDALVLGRRGYAALSEWVSSSVSSNMLDEPLASPVWICRKEAQGPRNVLLCVDGSPASLRMADHVGFMLQDETHRICLFHVMSGEGGRDAARILDEAQGVLTANGVDPQRIDRRLEVGGKVSDLILEEAARGHYPVIATGHQDESRGLFSSIFTGPVCTCVLKKLEHGSLWVSK
ncbi:Universal stress protein family protein [Desulfacinum hydrothermale DSM 13146]|uniref:Universal stress protein family protein n=1 Tax=Desulfacinum hydrothermale DSM 13146 TaxID=1121390 RepID=A0A1W1XUA3_9BACT|nr:universal stress protein [Desulfacinum hydrothermale]SMC27121.1 Universal stress protein family protein [Desulfacinum hydrothermale DSM 13146]